MKYEAILQDRQCNTIIVRADTLPELHSLIGWARIKYNAYLCRVDNVQDNYKVY